jgi:16S rRNA (uracil1498-N3)-methyltransferase
VQLFYNPNITKIDTAFVFDKDESRHIVKVLRKQIGDKLVITNGKGYLFYTEVTVSDIKRCEVKVLSHEFKERRPFRLHIAIAPTKMNDRYEWFLEKATEIGIEEITPIFCDHSERKVIKPERMEKILQSAMKQSLHCYHPKLNPSVSFDDFITSNFKGHRFIAHCEESHKIALKTALKKKSDCLILIGPEGDFSVKEIETAKEHQFIPVTLGNTRLRTETAGIVACHTVALINE